MANQYKVSGQSGTLLNYKRIRFACGPQITEIKWSTKDLIDTDEWVIPNNVDMESGQHTMELQLPSIRQRGSIHVQSGETISDLRKTKKANNHRPTAKPDGSRFSTAF
jgi:hypothetical protein